MCRFVASASRASYSSRGSPSASQEPISILAIASGLPPSRMSVPRPAMLVEMVTEPGRPAWAMMSASLAWCLALRTLCLMAALVSSRWTSSDRSTDAVPTSTGRPASTISWISAITASNLSASVL